MIVLEPGASMHYACNMVRKLSLRLGLSGSFLLIVMLTGVLTGAGSWINLGSVVKRGIQDRLHDTVALSAALIDPQLHAVLYDPANIGSQEHLALLTQCQAIRNVNPDIRYVYTMVKDQQGKIRFMLDSDWSPEPNADNSDIAHFGDVYDDVTPDIIAFMNKPEGIMVADEFYSDRWGTWLTGLAPVVNADGSLACVIGIDIAADTVRDYQMKHLVVIGLIVLCLIIPVALVGLVFARRISKPIQDITVDMKRIQNLELQGELKSSTFIREVSEMHDAVDDMKKGLRSFRKYVPADLVNELIRLRKEAVLGAEKTRISVSFSDIENFTNISEEIGPERLSESLGEYLEGMTGILTRHQATVDKYIGDAIMSFWGAPRVIENPTMHACKAALECVHYLDEAGHRWVAEGKPALPTRIGINTGEAIVGNMGYSERLSYTAIGDTVNLASRLEGLNKMYGTNILVSETAYEETKELFEYRFLDVVAVKGKKQGIRIYELLSVRDALPLPAMKRMQVWGEAMDHYVGKRWKESLAAFTDLKDGYAVDKALDLMISRVSGFVSNPPPKDWNGIIILREK